MLDLGLTKLAVIGAVALVVIGPEKLPTVARMAGTLYGRAQRYLRDVKSEVSRELEVEQLRDLHKELLAGAAGLKSEVGSVKSDVDGAVQSGLALAEPNWQAQGYLPLPTPAIFQTPPEVKARDFRRTKRALASNVPAWYKNRRGPRQHVRSCAARKRLPRTSLNPNTSFF